jgi:D-arabinose 5-phosphate isomerase GutQ
VDARGSSHTSLQTQSALWFLFLNRVPNATIHRILHINHKAIEDMDKRMMQLRKAWVEEKEKLIVFGNGKT